MSSINRPEVQKGMYKPEVKPGQFWVVGAAIVDEQGKLFLQRRSANRKLFPNCWNMAGGHVEPGETLHEALTREILEETGWKLAGVIASQGPFSWTANGTLRHEIDYLVNVEGDLFSPNLEVANHSEFRWIDQTDLHKLQKSQQPSEAHTFQVIKHFLEFLSSNK